MKNFSFNQMSDAELFISVGLVVQRCLNNPFLFSSKQPVANLTTAYAIFGQAFTIVQKKGGDSLPFGDTRRHDLIAALVNLQKSITDVADQGKESFTEKKTDFDVFQAFTAAITINSPTDISAVNAARSGYVRLFWSGTSSAIMHLVECRRQGEIVWQSKGHTTQSLLLMSGFERGVYYEFRICALGKGQLRSVWTEPVGIWVA
jgi:hypothetical protein